MFNSTTLFYLFSIFLVISSSMVIMSQSAVFSLLFLVASFIFSSFLLILLECEFLALLLIVVYVGAVAILFLFSIMMLESKQNNLLKNHMKYIPFGLIFSFLFLFPLLNEVSFYFDTILDREFFHFNIYQNWYDLADSISDIEVYSQVLYSYYVLQFLISGFILLLVLISVVYLSNTFVKQQILEQSAFKQLSRNSKFFI